MKPQGIAALVTGGASGLGLASAKKLLAAGAAVTLVDLPTSAGALMARELGERCRFAPADVQDTLKRLDQVEDPSAVKTDQEYDEIAQDFYNDITVANRTLISFYDAVINQPASFRNYQTEFDPYYGDVLRLGIILYGMRLTFQDIGDVGWTGVAR